MRNYVNKRTIKTHLIESEEPLNLRVFAELIARDILKGDYKK